MKRKKVVLKRIFETDIMTIFYPLTNVRILV